MKNLNCWCCYLKMVSGVLLWLAAAVTLVFGWLASVDEFGFFFGLDGVSWYFTAVALGVLAVGCKGYCEVCGHGTCR